MIGCIRPNWGWLRGNGNLMMEIWENIHRNQSIFNGTQVECVFLSNCFNLLWKETRKRDNGCSRKSTLYCIKLQTQRKVCCISYVQIGYFVHVTFRIHFFFMICTLQFCPTYASWNSFAQFFIVSQFTLLTNWVKTTILNNKMLYHTINLIPLVFKHEP